MSRLSETEITAATGVSARALRSYSNGERTPSAADYLALLRVLEVPPDATRSACVWLAREGLKEFGDEICVTTHTPETYIRAAVAASGLTGADAEDVVRAVLSTLPRPDRITR
jgi:transcriptional regulator with XRE-family HTH domain